MRKFVIITDNTADLPDQYFDSHGLGLISLSYTIDGQTYEKGNELPFKEFYDKMRAGAMPTSSQINPESARKEFQAYLDQDLDILYIAFSSGLSGTYQTTKMAAEELNEEIGERRIIVVDSLCASLGEGLLVHQAVKMKEAGKSLTEIAGWLEENKLHLCHMFTVDDLNHLHRGGRVSKTAAILGTMVNIKPILHVDNEGHLIPLGKVRGRKKSLMSLVDNMEERIGSYLPQNDQIFISHGDCEEDARFVAEEVTKRFGIKDFLINPVGPTIGTHTGPGVVALFFLGEKR